MVTIGPRYICEIALHPKTYTMTSIFLMYVMKTLSFGFRDFSLLKYPDMNITYC